MYFQNVNKKKKHWIHPDVKEGDYNPYYNDQSQMVNLNTFYQNRTGNKKFEWIHPDVGEGDLNPFYPDDAQMITLQKKIKSQSLWGGLQKNVQKASGPPTLEEIKKNIIIEEVKDEKRSPIREKKTGSGAPSPVHEYRGEGFHQKVQKADSIMDLIFPAIIAFIVIESIK